VTSAPSQLPFELNVYVASSLVRHVLDDVRMCGVEARGGAIVRYVATEGPHEEVIGIVARAQELFLHPTL
jgi:hypothetical protein